MPPTIESEAFRQLREASGPPTLAELSLPTPPLTATAACPSTGHALLNFTHMEKVVTSFPPLQINMLLHELTAAAPYLRGLLPVPFLGDCHSPDGKISRSFWRFPKAWLDKLRALQLVPAIPAVAAILEGFKNPALCSIERFDGKTAPYDDYLEMCNLHPGKGNVQLMKYMEYRGRLEDLCYYLGCINSRPHPVRPNLNWNPGELFHPILTKGGDLLIVKAADGSEITLRRSEENAVFEIEEVQGSNFIERGLRCGSRVLLDHGILLSPDASHFSVSIGAEQKIRLVPQSVSKQRKPWILAEDRVRELDLLESCPSVLIIRPESSGGASLGPPVPVRVSHIKIIPLDHAEILLNTALKARELRTFERLAKCHTTEVFDRDGGRQHVFTQEDKLWVYSIQARKQSISLIRQNPNSELKLTFDLTNSTVSASVGIYNANDPIVCNVDFADWVAFLELMTDSINGNIINTKAA